MRQGECARTVQRMMTNREAREHLHYIINGDCGIDDQYAEDDDEIDYAQLYLTGYTGEADELIDA